MPVLGPRLKIIRRLGTPLRGLTRKDGERRPYPPGVHGQKPVRRKKNEFRRQLEEKQKMRFHYGVSEAQLRRAFEAATKQPGRTGDNLFSLLERRLSNVVFRLGFAPTIPAARQLVSHGNVLVNGRRLDRPSALVSVGDVITLSEKSRSGPSVLDAITRGPQVRLPGYLALDPSEKFEGRVINMPMRGDVPFIVDEAAIVEFYAR